MKTKQLHIKNMVCDRCIAAVKQTLNNMQIPVLEIDLGKVTIPNQEVDKQQLNKALKQKGFELLQDKNDIVSAQVKAILIDLIHYRTDDTKINYSDYLKEGLNMDYAVISKIFSKTEGLTIEKFIILQKIEKVKELIDYGELNFSEIAYKLQYSSVSHLSRQFKKVTGLTLSQYKNQSDSKRNSLDRIHKNSYKP